MRAGDWSNYRDITAAQTSWQRARQVADRLPADDPDRLRCASRRAPCSAATPGASGAASPTPDSTNCATCARRRRQSVAGDRHDRDVGDAITLMHSRCVRRLVSRPNTPHLLDSLGDPTLTVALLVAAVRQAGKPVSWPRRCGWRRRVIDLAGGDPTKGNLIFGSPLAAAIAYARPPRWALGHSRLEDDLMRPSPWPDAVDPRSAPV